MRLDRPALQALRLRGLADIDKGNISEGDSLLCIADSAGILDALDMLRWMSAKAVLARYYDAGRLCCRVSAQQPQLAPIACARLFEIVKDQSVETKRLALGAYKQCALSQERCDTLQVKQWLSRTYGFFAMFAEETDLLRDLDSRRFPSGRDFLAIGRDRFSMGFFSDAVVPAMEAYRRLSEAPERSLAATIVYQCYLRLNKSADAALWLPRTELSDVRFRAQAAAFLQRAGFLDKADSLTATLPASVARDTLAVRQALFAGNPSRARELARGLRGDRDAALIWTIRTSVFSGNGGDLEGWIDTVAMQPSGEYGREMLAYRYKLELLKDASQAYQDFGVLEYAVWLGQPKKATGMSFAAYAPMVRQMLACDLVAALLEKDLAPEAQKVALQVPPGEGGPELEFYKGDILIRQGSITEGSKVLEQLVISHPNDVFAIRAKQVLASLGQARRN